MVVVPVRNISRVDLDQFLPHRFAIGRFIGAEVEWFADEARNSIGTIAQGTTNRNWGYVVLRRDEVGQGLIWDLKTGIESGLLRTAANLFTGKPRLEIVWKRGDYIALAVLALFLATVIGFWP